MRRVILYLFIYISAAGFAQQKLNLLPDTVGVCFGDSAKLEIKSNVLLKSASYQWITPRGFIEFVKSINVYQQGKYYIKVKSGLNTFLDSCYVKYNKKPRVNFHDTSICNSTQAVIDARNVGCKYLWSTDQTTQKIRIESQGKYWVKVNNNGCAVSDTFFVFFNSGPSPNFPDNLTFCMSDENKTLSVKNTQGATVKWNNGATTPSITVTRGGYYWVKTSTPLCGTRVDSVNVILKACDCEILIPNSFTPNEDGKNDYFFPVLACEYSYYLFVIYDRWQNPVFTTNNINGKWDGRFKGNLCPDDVYVYHIETIEKTSGKKDVKDGKVSLFR